MNINITTCRILKLDMAYITLGSSQNDSGRAHFSNCCFCLGERVSLPSLSLKSILKVKHGCTTQTFERFLLKTKILSARL